MARQLFLTLGAKLYSPPSTRLKSANAGNEYSIDTPFWRGRPSSQTGSGPLQKPSPSTGQKHWRTLLNMGLETTQGGWIHFIAGVGGTLGEIQPDRLGEPGWKRGTFQGGSKIRRFGGGTPGENSGWGPGSGKNGCNMGKTPHLYKGGGSTLNHTRPL